MKVPSFSAVILVASVTFKRFPLAITSAVIASFYCTLLAGLPYEQESSHFYYWNVLKTCYLGLLLFIVLKILIETRNIEGLRAILLQLAGLIALAFYYYSLPAHFMTVDFTRFVLFVLILHLIIAFVPFLQRGSVDKFWEYNKALFLGIQVSFFYTIVLYAGLALALLAIEKLFNVTVQGKMYADLWWLLAGVFNTWLFLAAFPRFFLQDEFERPYPKGLKIFTQYVLLPLVTIYLAILYAYMFRIIIKASWPVGWVSYLVIGFSTTGILSLLLIYPVRNDPNNKWILIFSRFFYIALFPLIVLLFFAVQKRIGDYGVTEDRYYILILALWLLFIAIYFLFSRSKNIKFIPISLSVLALITAFGPWSAFDVSLKSQDRRLQHLFEQNALLRNGKVVPQRDSVSYKDNEQINSIISYLVKAHGYKTLQHYFTANLDSVIRLRKYHTVEDYFDNDYAIIEKVEKLLNIELVTKNASDLTTLQNNYVYVNSDRREIIINIHGYDYFIEYIKNDPEKPDSTCTNFAITGGVLSVCYNHSKKQFAFFKNRKDTELVCNISPMLQRLYKGGNQNFLPLQEMTYTNGNDNLKVMIVFDNVNFMVYTHDTTINFNADIYIKNLQLQP